MFGLAILMIIGVYVAISAGLVFFAKSQAKKRGIPEWKFGTPVAVVMFLFIFWEDVPTMVAYHHYCNLDAGFVVNKTLEEWRAENPGVAEKQVYTGEREQSANGSTIITHISDRFDYVSIDEVIFTNVRRRIRQFVDTVNQEVLAEDIDYRSSASFDLSGLFGLKEWLSSRSCVEKKDRKLFGKYWGEFSMLRGKRE